MAPIGDAPIAVVTSTQPGTRRPDFGMEAGQRWT